MTHSYKCRSHLRQAYAESGRASFSIKTEALHSHGLLRCAMMIAMKRALGLIVVFVAGMALWSLAFALVGDVAQTLGFISSLLVLPLVYRWHRREIRAGRREPVFFGKGKHYPPPNGYVPFDEAMTELGHKLERHPKEARTN